MRQPKNWSLALLFVIFFIVCLIFYFQIGRPWLLKWGASAWEETMPMPGDELVPNPSYQSTRALTVNAPAERIWAWLIQIGQNRGGFYSYHWLENLVFADIRNSDRIHPEWQQPAVGDLIQLTPKNYPLGLVRRNTPDPVMAPAIHAIQPPNQLVLKGWGAFLLTPQADGRTRFIIRGRNSPMRGMNQALMAVFFDPLHFVMERQMMRNIRRLAESRPAAGAGWLKLLAFLGFAVASLAGAMVLALRPKKRLWLLAPFLWALLIVVATADWQAALVGFCAVTLIISGIVHFRRWSWIYILSMWLYAHLVLFFSPDAFIVFGLVFLLLSPVLAWKWRAWIPVRRWTKRTTDNRYYSSSR